MIEKEERIQKRKNKSKESGQRHTLLQNKWPHKQLDRQTGRKTDRETDKHSDKKKQTNSSSPHLELASMAVTHE